jgi:hypothetical protein
METKDSIIAAADQLGYRCFLIPKDAPIAELTKLAYEVHDLLIETWEAWIADWLAKHSKISSVVISIESEYDDAGGYYPSPIIHFAPVAGTKLDEDVAWQLQEEIYNIIPTIILYARNGCDTLSYSKQ